MIVNTISKGEISEAKANDTKGIYMRSSKHLAKILIPALIGVLLLAVGFWIYMGSMGKPYDSENAASVSVEIPSGTSAAGIAQTLEDNGIIASANKFRLWSKSKGWDSKYKAGTYALSPSMDYAEIAEILVGGKVSMKTFTVPEGLTVAQTTKSWSIRAWAIRLYSRTSLKIRSG